MLYPTMISKSYPSDITPEHFHISQERIANWLCRYNQHVIQNNYNHLQVYKYTLNHTCLQQNNFQSNTMEMKYRYQLWKVKSESYQKRCGQTQHTSNISTHCFDQCNQLLHFGLPCRFQQLMSPAISWSDVSNIFWITRNGARGEAIRFL